MGSSSGHQVVGPRPSSLMEPVISMAEGSGADASRSTELDRWRTLPGAAAADAPGTSMVDVVAWSPRLCLETLVKLIAATMPFGIVGQPPRDKTSNLAGLVAVSDEFRKRNVLGDLLVRTVRSRPLGQWLVGEHVHERNVLGLQLDQGGADFGEVVK